MDDEPVIKTEVICCLNLPNEIITIDDDDDDDTCEITYLEKLYQKLDDMNIVAQRFGRLRNVPIETIDIDSDSDAEIHETHEENNFITVSWLGGDTPNFCSLNF